MVNWRSVGVGTAVTLILAFIGLFVPFLSILAPIIGGFVAAYMAGGDYGDGAANGGVAGGIGLLIFVGLFLALFGAIGGALIGDVGLGAAAGGIVGAVIGLIIGLILGIIGGVIGIVVKGKDEEISAEKPVPETAPVKESPNIPFNMGNIHRCLCPTCSVQGESSCAKEKMINMQEIMQGEQEEKPSLNPEEFPGMYCTNGQAVCKDIDTSQYCICENCAIHKEYDLDNANPTFLYCKEGKAQ